MSRLAKWANHPVEAIKVTSAIKEFNMGYDKKWHYDGQLFC